MVLVEYVELGHVPYVESLVRTCSFFRYHTRVDRVINKKSQLRVVSIREREREMRKVEKGIFTSVTDREETNIRTKTGSTDGHQRRAPVHHVADIYKNLTESKSCIMLS